MKVIICIFSEYSRHGILIIPMFFFFFFLLEGQVALHGDGGKMHNDWLFYIKSQQSHFQLKPNNKCKHHCLFHSGACMLLLLLAWLTKPTSSACL